MSSGDALRVLLAGYNLDVDSIEALKRSAYKSEEPPPEESLTPETLSAAYARISRNPAEIPELRATARLEVEKARKSNDTIIFGLGHSSVAEHVAFNFDVLGISRLAVEAVEWHRLASFTEKSQRYIKLDGDFAMPAEIAESPLANDFTRLIEVQNDAYAKLYPKLYDHFYQRYKAEGRDKPKTTAKGRAAEDARYVVSLATQAQFGMTVNARTLEKMIRKTTAHPLSEVRRFGELLHKSVEGLAPSLVKYVQTTEYEQQLHKGTSRYVASEANSRWTEPEVSLVSWDNDGEDRVLAALVSRHQGVGFEEASRRIQDLAPAQRRQMIIDELSPGKQWDPPPREFELTNFTFELVISATAFAQLKRHRMATQVPGPYDPALSWTTPQCVTDTGMNGYYDEVMSRSAKFANKLAEFDPAIAPYALTNAHRRRVIFSANARELYHVSRLREDLHAQWDIRQSAAQMIALVREKMPNLFALACGKHEFNDKKAGIV